MRTALTADELTLLRCEIQASHLYLAVHIPATLFTARVNGSVTYPLAQIPFNTGSGSNCPADVTVWVGSSAGARDKGTLRLRGALTAGASGNLDVAELGQYAINVADQDYITIVEDYRIAARYPRYAGGVWYMDFDTSYLNSGSGNNYKPNEEYGPLARTGPAAIGFLEAGTRKLRYVGERSHAYTSGKSISTYAWTFPGTASPATSSSQGTTASPIGISYTAAIPGGRYHALTVTESTTGKTHIRHALTFIFERSGANAPFNAELLTSLSGGVQQGGYAATIKILNTTADQTSFPDGAHVVLFEEAIYADDAGGGNIDRYWYIYDATGAFTVSETVTGAASGATGTVISASSTLIKIRSTLAFESGETITGGTSGKTAEIQAPCVGGNYPYRCNVVLEGWIVGETVRKSATTGEIEFSIATVDEVMRGELGYSVALTGRSNLAKVITWEDFYQLTLDRAVLHFAKWRSTIGNVVDITLHGDLASTSPAATTIIKYCDMDAVNLFEQLLIWQTRTMPAWIASDMQSALYCELDAQIDDITRAATISAFTVAAGDRRGTLDIGRVAHRQANAQSTLYAVAYRTPLGSRTPDDPHAYQGLFDEITEGMAAPTQAILNEWASNHRAKLNNLYPSVAHEWIGNWRLDAVPQSYIVESLDAADTIRGIAWSSQKLLLRDLRLDYRSDLGMLLSDSNAEAETTGLGAATITFPPVSDPPFSPVPLPDQPGLPPGVSTDASELWFATDTPKNVVWGKFDPASMELTALSVLPSDLNVLLGFQMTLDGTIAYLMGTSTGFSDRRIWKCTNPRDATPSWTAILTYGDTLPSGTLSNVYTWNTLGSFLYVQIASSTNRHYYGAYNGSTWDYVQIAAPLGGWNHGGCTQRSSLDSAAVDPLHLRNTHPLATVDTVTESPSLLVLRQIWRNLLVGDRYFYYRTASGSGFIRRADAAANVSTVSAAAVDGSYAWLWVRGLLKGSQVQYVNSSGITTAATGQLFVSQDGTTFTGMDTWMPGFAECLSLADGAPMIWMPKLTTNSNEILRYSPSRFPIGGTPPNIVAISHNFWQDIQLSGNFSAVNLQVVFGVS